MIKFDTIDEYRKSKCTKDMLSIQDVIDILLNLKLPEGRSLDNIPFGIATSKGLRGFTDKEKLFLTKVFTPVLLLNVKESVIVTQESELYQKLEYLYEENEKLKSIIKDINKLTDGKVYSSRMA